MEEAVDPEEAEEAVEFDFDEGILLELEEDLTSSQDLPGSGRSVS